MLDEEAYIFEVRYLHRKHGRICGGHKCEGGPALPGEVCPSVPLEGGTTNPARGSGWSGRSQQRA